MIFRGVRHRDGLWLKHRQFGLLGLGRGGEMQTAESSIVCHTARRPVCLTLSSRSSREDLHPTMHTSCAFEAFALKAIVRSVASGCDGVRAVLVGSSPAARRQPCVGGADAPSLGGAAGSGMTSRGSVDCVVGMTRTGTPHPHPHTGLSRSLDRLGRSLDHRARLAHQAQRARLADGYPHHFTHPPVSAASPVPTQLGESAVVSGRYGIAQDLVTSVVALGGVSAAVRLRSSRRGSSDPGRS